MSPILQTVVFFLSMGILYDWFEILLAVSKAYSEALSAVCLVTAELKVSGAPESLCPRDSVHKGRDIVQVEAVVEM